MKVVLLLELHRPGMALNVICLRDSGDRLLHRTDNSQGERVVQKRLGYPISVDVEEVNRTHQDKATKTRNGISNVNAFELLG